MTKLSKLEHFKAAMISILKSYLLTNFYVFLINVINICILFCNVMQFFIFLAPHKYYTPHWGPLLFCRVGQRHYWLRYRTDYCSFLFERRDPHSLPARLATDEWLLQLFVDQLCHRFHTFQLRPQHQDRQSSHPNISRLTVRSLRTRHYRPRIKSRRKQTALL